MGRTADSKLNEADRLDERARKLDKRDPESSQRFRDMARKKRRQAIRQMSRVPRRRAPAAVRSLR